MTHEEFKELVKSMRILQKEYFQTHDRSILARAKAIEKRVDEYLSDKPDEQELQPKLF